jgi:glycosyltransferase involved in cell wall biosynthesis
MDATNKLHILFFNESYLGGMAGSKRIQNIINSLLKIENIKISNLILENKNTKVKNDLSKGIKNKVEFKKSYYSTKNPFQLIVLYLNAYFHLISIKKRKTKNILYHYDSPTILTLPIVLFAKLIGYKVVFDIVENYNLLDKKNLSLPKKTKIYLFNLLENNIASYSNGIIAISEYLMNELANRTKNKKPIHFVPITVNFDNFNIEIKTQNEITTIFYGGSFGEKDGLIYLLQAFEKTHITYPNTQLVLTGKPPKAGMNSILQFIDNSPSKNAIIFKGYLDDDKYYKTLCESDILCMNRVNSAYANAGFPFKLGEMLATEKPVIATKVGNISDLLINQENAILIEPNSIDELSDAIKYLISNPEKAKNIGIKGKHIAKENFDSDIISIKLAKFLMELN